MIYKHPEAVGFSEAWDEIYEQILEKLQKLRDANVKSYLQQQTDQSKKFSFLKKLKQKNY